MNLNNTATNTNWNIGSACFYPRNKEPRTECLRNSYTADG